MNKTQRPLIRNQLGWIFKRLTNKKLRWNPKTWSGRRLPKFAGGSNQAASVVGKFEGFPYVCAAGKFHGQLEIP